MGIIAVLLILWGIGVLIYNMFKKPDKERSNHYINVHAKKLKDDKLYKEYIDWCFKQGEAPMDKKGFDSIRDKEQKIYELMNKKRN
jgi:hypothetical protein